jgi:apolipoprotein N-acyltransferase
VVARAPQFVPDVLLGEARPFTGLTPYARTGNWPVLLLATLMVLVAAGVTALGEARRRRLNAASR